MTSLHLIFMSVILFILVSSGSNVEVEPSVFTKLQSDVFASLNLPNASQTRNQISFENIPGFMLQLYRKKNGNLKRLSRMLARQPLKDDTVRVFFPKGKKIRRTSFLVSELTLSFDLSSVRMNEERISYVELRLHRRKSKVRSTFGIYSVAIFSRPPTKRNKDSFLGIKMFPNSRKLNWISFNVTRAVNQYLKNPKHKPSNAKLYVQVHGRVEKSCFWISLQGKRRPLLIVFSDHPKKSNRFLDVNLLKQITITDSAKVQSRQKREDLVGKYCQRRRLFVNFRSINVNWVIAPSGFTANYCRGICPEILSSYFNPTNHAILQSLLHHRYSKRIPSTTCVPTKLHSLTLLYIAEGGTITLREFPDMVVSRCGCL